MWRVSKYSTRYPVHCMPEPLPKPHRHAYQTRFIMASQYENIHLGPFPYLADPVNPAALFWEDYIQESATARAYAMTTGSYNYMAAIGAAGAFDPLGNTIAEMSANVDMVETPMLYATINTAFNTSKTYDVDGQTSWGILQEIVNAYPKDIPRVEGNLILYREKSVAWLSSGALTTEMGNEWGQ